jgi:hypothetical protein
MMKNGLTPATQPSLLDRFNDSKRAVANLMARENITVQVVDGAKTAMFDTVRRVLTIPNWRDMTVDQCDLLIAHEIGHALFTNTSFIKNLKDQPSKGLHSYFNIVEDARIERKMKNSFPGLARVFYNGYREFHANGPIFKGDQTTLTDPRTGTRVTVATMKMIDRVNLHYKIGAFVTVPFSEAERPFLARIDKCASVEEAMVIARDLQKFAKDQDRAEQTPPPPPAQPEQPEQSEPEQSEPSDEPQDADTSEPEEAESDESTESASDDADDETDSDDDATADDDAEGDDESDSTDAEGDESDDSTDDETSDDSTSTTGDADDDADETDSDDDATGDEADSDDDAEGDDDAGNTDGDDSDDEADTSDMFDDTLKDLASDEIKRGHNHIIFLSKFKVQHTLDFHRMYFLKFDLYILTIRNHIILPLPKLHNIYLTQNNIFRFNISMNNLMRVKL